MKKLRLEPIRENPGLSEKLKNDVLRVLKKEFYGPLMKLVSHSSTWYKPRYTHNSLSSLKVAIRTGKVRYTGFAFVGTFDSRLASAVKELGGTWWGPGWSVPAKDLPEDIKEAIRDAKVRDDALRIEIDSALHKIDPQKIADAIDVTRNFSRTDADVSQKFLRSVRKLAVQPVLSEEETIRIRQEYAESLRLGIRNWIEEEILRLRKRVTEHVFEGNRYEELSKSIKASFGSSEKKARFLARQETNLLTAKIKEVRYASAGIDEYYWRAVQGTPAHPVRELHKKLSDESKRGKTFRFSDPPVSGTNGEKMNPGEPYSCRCIAVPVVRVRS